MFESVLDGAIDHAPIAVPIVFSLSLLLLRYILHARKTMSLLFWRRVDFCWIVTSAVTVTFMALSMKTAPLMSEYNSSYLGVF